MEEMMGICTETELMSRYLDPTNDIAFKKLFAQKQRLISFLNAILNLKIGYRIKELEFLDKEQAPLIKEAKTTIVDVKCTDESGRQYIVEMQNRKIPAFVKRAQIYASHSYVSQFSSGEDYTSLKPVILLCLANHILFPNKARVVSYHDTLDRDTGEHDLQEISYVFIELPKFDKKEQDLLTVQDQWIYFFKNWSCSQAIPSTIKEEALIDAYHAMEQFNWTKSELEEYFKSKIALADEFLARQAEREEGKAEGKAEERAKAEREKVALQAQAEQEKAALQAQAEREKAALQAQAAQEKQEIARNLKSQGIPVSIIQSATQLSVKEIEKL